MKKSIFLWSLTLMSGFLFSQEMITIDYQKMNFTDKENNLLKPVEYGQFYIFQIKDINKFLFKVTIKGESVQLETPVPTELQRLFRLPKEEQEESLSDSGSKDDLNQVKNQADVMLASIKLSNDYGNLFLKGVKNEKNKLNKSSIEQEKLEQKINEIEGILNEFDKIKTEINDLSSLLEKTINEEDYLKIQLIKLINLATRDVDFNTMKEDVLSNVDLKPKDPTANSGDIEKAFNQIKFTMTELKVKLQQNTELSTEFNKLEKLFEALKLSYSKIDKVKIVTLFSQVDYLFNELQNESNFKAIAPPVQADGDFLNYDVTITPSRTNNLGAYMNTKTFDFDVPVKAGLKVDFSVGPVFAFGNGALDEKYYFESTDVENMSTLKERDNNNILNPGIAAMMHYYKRSGKNMSWGGLFGVGAGFQSIEDINLSFYGGISFVLGKEQKIMLNTGLAFMNVDRLKNNQFQVDTNYNTTTVSLNDVTEKVFKGSFFISISYNLAKRVQN